MADERVRSPRGDLVCPGPPTLVIVRRGTSRDCEILPKGGFVKSSSELGASCITEVDFKPLDGSSQIRRLNQLLADLRCCSIQMTSCSRVILPAAKSSINRSCS